MKFNTIEEALNDIKAGKVVIVIDDADRENEGDFVTAVANAAPEVINFMAMHGRGLVCAALTEERCQQLNLNMMVDDNTSLQTTAFTVSVDLLGHGRTTGISASDRSKTIVALINPDIIEVRAIEEAEGVTVFGEVGGDPVHNQADVGLMAGINEGHEVVGRAVAAGGGKVAGHLVAPRAVKGVFGDGHQFDVGEAEVFDIGDEGVYEIA